MSRSYAYRPLGSSDAADHVTHHLMEQENDRLAQGLTNKVRLLKSLTIDIGNEAGSQNLLLDDVGNEFVSSGGLLHGSMGRLTKLTETGHRKLMCYLVLFAITVFFICYGASKWF